MNYDIEALKRKMLVKYPFFGSVVASVDYKISENIQTAGTDGESIYYNPKYLESLSVEEQTFVFAHEVCHIAFNHILRSEGKDPQLWNIATDGVINQFIMRDGLKMPLGGIDIKDAINYDAEELYEKLLKEKQEEQKKQEQQEEQEQEKNNSQNQENKEQSNSSSQSSDDNKQSDGQNNSSSGSSDEQGKKSQEQGEEQSKEEPKKGKPNEDAGHDTHSMWEEAIKKHKEEQESSNKNDNNLENEKKELEKNQEKLEGMGEKEAFDKNLEERKEQLEKLKQEILEQASQAGNSTNGDIRAVNNVGNARPIIDWRYILKEAITYDVDWSYRNATIEDGVVTANLEKLPMSETEIVLDTSGSIDDVLLKNFLRECKNILQNTKLKVGCFDTAFYGFNEIRTEEDIENMTFVGGGGTDFDVAIDAFSRRTENKIIFTDGEAPMPKKTMNVIWIVFGDEKINPKGGRVIQITPEKLRRLYSYEIENVDENRSR